MPLKSAYVLWHFAGALVRSHVAVDAVATRCGATRIAQPGWHLFQYYHYTLQLDAKLIIRFFVGWRWPEICDVMIEMMLCT